MAFSDSSPQSYQRIDPRSRPMEAWRARKAVMASRGETSGPRVDEATAALKFWEFVRRLDKAVADGLIDQSFAAAAADVAACSARDGIPQQASGPGEFRHLGSEGDGGSVTAPVSPAGSVSS